MNNKKKITVTLFYRKPWESGSYSIENSFALTESYFPKTSKYMLRHHECKHSSKGIYKRLLAILDTFRNASQINHITGDVHFLTFGLFHKTTILTIHDCGFLQGKSKLKKTLLLWIWLKLPIRLSTIVTTVSQTTKNEVVKLANANEKKILVVPTSVSLDFIYNPKRFNTHKPVILHIGTTANKNLIRHIEACGSIACKLLIVGKLNDEQINHLELNNIDYINKSNLSNDEIIQTYIESDILLFCSTSEGFGMPIIEAQLTGRPVITSNLSSMPEVGGTNGAYYANPYDVNSINMGLVKIIRDTTFREALIKNGRKNAARFNPEVIAKTYEKIYESVN